MYTLHLYFYVFAEAVAVAIIDGYPTTASSVLLFSKQALQHCFNSRARQIFDGHAASSQAFRRRRASRPRCRQQPSCSTTKRHEAENASDLKVQVATSSQAIRQRRADYSYVFAEPSPSPSSIATRRQHHLFCYSRSKLFNTASTQKMRQVSPELLLRICIFEDCFRFLMDMPLAARLFDDEERAVPVAASSHAVRQQ